MLKKTLVMLSLITASFPAFAGPSVAFCEAEGVGVWGGKKVDLRVSASIVGKNVPEAIAWADEQPAAVFNLTRSQDGSWEGVAEKNKKVSIKVTATPGGAFTAELNDWNNQGTFLVGTCESF